MKEELKTIFPEFNERDLNKIINYLNNYKISEKQKIIHIKNLYKLAYISYQLYINSGHNEIKK